VAGNSLLHFLRGSLEDAESGNLILEPGQPFYNYNKNYLTIGGKDGNTKVNGKPLTVREVIGYAGESNSITGNLNLDNEFHLKYDDNSNTLELLTPNNFVLKSSSYNILSYTLNSNPKLEISDFTSSSAYIYNLQFGPNYFVPDNQDFGAETTTTFYGLMGSEIGCNTIIPIETTNIIKYVYQHDSSNLVQIMPDSSSVKVNLGISSSPFNKLYVDTATIDKLVCSKTEINRKVTEIKKLPTDTTSHTWVNRIVVGSVTVTVDSNSNLLFNGEVINTDCDILYTTSASLFNQNPDEYGKYVDCKIRSLGVIISPLDIKNRVSNEGLTGRYMYFAGNSIALQLKGSDIGWYDISLAAELSYDNSKWVLEFIMYTLGSSISGSYSVSFE
jgi:hypothetical protein